MKSTLSETLQITPRPEVLKVTPYTVPRAATPVDLFLDGNEGMIPALDKRLKDLLSDPEKIRRYPSTTQLESVLARRFALAREHVLVTAGGDEAIDRACRTVLGPGRSIILPVPTFVMFSHYATLAGGNIKTVTWDSKDYPTDKVLNTIDESTAAIAVVSPNNPTGTSASEADLRRIAESAPEVLVIVDQAYAEFSDDNLTGVALEYPNCVVIRSLSKAWGLAGLRVGYVLGAPEVISWFRGAGGPYSVSSLSIHLAQAALEASGNEMNSYIATVKQDRSRITQTLTTLGAKPTDSRANFVFARFPDVSFVRDGLAGLGISVRAFPDDRLLSDALRITCPPAGQIERLIGALNTVMAPEALLFDLDGVLADVGNSYREAIIQTAATFDVVVTREDIQKYKASGNANNDWILTQKILADKGKVVGLDLVKKRFEAIYHGTASEPGLKENEELIADIKLLETLHRQLPLAIVTGRPRADAEQFLDRFGIKKFFNPIISMEDAEMKPSSEPVIAALGRLGVQRAWIIGDTPDDMRSARGAGVLPLGIVPPGEESNTVATSLIAAGAGRVLNSLNQLKDLLP